MSFTRLVAELVIIMSIGLAIGWSLEMYYPFIGDLVR